MRRHSRAPGRMRRPIGQRQILYDRDACRGWGRGTRKPPLREPSDPVAPEDHRLLLLPSGPDRVHGPSPHRTEPPHRGIGLHYTIHVGKRFRLSCTLWRQRYRCFQGKMDLYRNRTASFASLRFFSHSHRFLLPDLKVIAIIGKGKINPGGARIPYCGRRRHIAFREKGSGSLRRIGPARRLLTVPRTGTQWSRAARSEAGVCPYTCRRCR